MVIVFAASVQASDSVFVDRAFQGTWRIMQANGQSGGLATFAQVDEATGSAQINTLADPNFNVNKCPPASEKREYYSAVDNDGLPGYFCTNGPKLVGRFRDQINNVTVYQEITITVVSTSPPTFAATGRQEGTSIVNNATGVPIGGQIATPLAQVAPDSLSVVSSGPIQGSVLAPGGVQDFSVTVNYSMTAHRNGTVQATVLNGSQVLGTSAPVSVTLGVTQSQRTFTVSGIAVPASGTLTVRTEMKTNAGAVSASADASFAVYQPPVVTVAPADVNYLCVCGGTPGPIFARPEVVLTASSGAVTYTASLVNGGVVNGRTWATVANATGTANPSATIGVVISVPTSPVAFTYLDTLRITTSAGVTTLVPVVYQVRDAQIPSRYLDPTGLYFESRQNQGGTVAQPVRVYGTSSANWTARATSGASLIQISPSSGTGAGSFSVALGPTATNTVGFNYAVVEVSSPSSPTLYVNVVSNVLPIAEAITPQPSTSGVYLGTYASGSQVSSQSFSVNVSSLVPVSFSATATTAAGNWLSVSPVAGTASSAAPGVVTVSASTSGLAAGTYTGTISIRIGDLVRGVRVLMRVTAPVAASDAAPGARTATACVPQGILLLESKIPSNFSVPAGWPASMAVRMLDDCGTPLVGGQVVARFTNGDAPVSFDNDGVTGDYFTTWQPRTALSGATKIQLRGSYGTLAAGTLEISGAVTANAANPPRLEANGILNNLNPIVGGPLAPGTVVQIYGDGMAAATETPSKVPLPTKVQGAELLVSGYSAPLYYVSNGQLVAQLPTELRADQPYAAILSVNGATSLPMMIRSAAVMPGVAGFMDGKLIAQHGSNYQLVTAENPARPGEALIMYLVGMGATNPQVASGIATPTDRLYSTVVQPVVTVDGQRADVPFAGLTPGGVGLYQINFVVPGNAVSGDLDVVITQDGTRANGTKVVVRK